MNDESKLTVEEFAARLDEVLNRVSAGERFAIHRDGESIAILAPPIAKLGITARELIAQVGNLEMPGDGFADDLEAIQAAQGYPEFPEWPD